MWDESDDDDDDLDDIDIDEDDDEEVLERYVLIEETDLDYGVTVWGIAAILFNGAADIAEDVANTLGLLGGAFSFLHNRNVDRERFVGSVEAGLEHLDRLLD